MRDLRDFTSMQHMIFLADFRDKLTFFDLEGYHLFKVNRLLLTMTETTPFSGLSGLDVFELCGRSKNLVTRYITIGMS